MSLHPMKWRSGLNKSFTLLVTSISYIAMFSKSTSARLSEQCEKQGNISQWPSDLKPKVQNVNCTCTACFWSLILSLNFKLNTVGM